MKYLLHDKGIQWFRDELTRSYFKDLKPLRNEPKAKLHDYLGWHRHRAGMWFVGIPLLCGRLEGDFKAGLRKIVETYQPMADAESGSAAVQHRHTATRPSVRPWRSWASKPPRCPLHSHAMRSPALHYQPADSRLRNQSGSFPQCWIALITSCSASRSPSRC